METSAYYQRIRESKICYEYLNIYEILSFLKFSQS